MNEDVVPFPAGLRNRLARAGADIPRLGAEPILTTAQFFAVWEAIGESSPPDFGLRFANETQIHEYDVSSLAALHSPDLRTALVKISRYKRLCGPKDLVVELSGSEAAVTTHWYHVDRPPPARLVDASLASQLILFQRGSGKPLAPKRVELMRPKSDEAMLMRFYGAPIRFRAKRDALVLDASALDLPFITRNDDLLQALVPGLDAKLAPLVGRGQTSTRSFIDDVRAAVARRMSGEKPSLEKIARELNVSARTLQRRLEEHGWSYQALLDDVRHETALRLLKTKDVDVPEIAFLLGFEELNSFSRAFRTWEGTTPNRYRSAVA